MYLSTASPHPVSSTPIPRWVMIAAALTLSVLIAAVILISPSNRVTGPGPAGPRPASVHSGYFRDPATHVLLPATAEVVSVAETSGAVAHPRP